MHVEFIHHAEMLFEHACRNIIFYSSILYSLQVEIIYLVELCFKYACKLGIAYLNILDNMHGE